MSTWHYMNGVTQMGPVPPEELRRLLSSRAIAANTMVWRAGLPAWVPANTVEEFMSLGSSPLNTPPSSPPPLTTAPVAKSNRTLITVICVLLGLFVVMGGCVVACTYFVGKKAKQYQADSEKNPQMAAVTLAATLAPNVQIVSKDETANTITLRNKKTGKISTIDLNAYSAENMAKAVEQFSKGITPSAPLEKRIESTDDDAEKNAAESDNEDAGHGPISPARASAMSDVLKKFPAFSSAYPRGKTTQATLSSLAGYTGGSYEFSTADSPESVIEYYEKKLAGADFIVVNKSSDANDHGPTASLVATRAKPTGAFSVTAESEEHGVKVAISFTER